MTKVTNCYFFFRKVKLSALQVIKQLIKSRKLGLCKDLMLQFSGYLLPTLEEESLTNLSQATSKSPSPSKPCFDEDRHMWQGLEKFIELLKETIFREGIPALCFNFNLTFLIFQLFIVQHFMT